MKIERLGVGSLQYWQGRRGCGPLDDYLLVVLALLMNTC
jgi:hypothetical protein